MGSWVLGVIALTGALSGADTPLSVSEILGRVAEKYRKAESFQFVVAANTQVLHEGTMQQLISAQITLAAAKPDKLRFELNSARQAVSVIQDGKKMARVPEGRTQWLVAVRGDEAGFDGGEALGTAVYALMQRYQTIDTRLKNAELAREEVLDADGFRTRCYVVRTPLAGSATEYAEEYWIDAQRFLVLKSVVTSLSSAQDERTALRSSIIYKVARVNEPIDAKMFRIVEAPKVRATGTRQDAEYAPAKTKKLKRVVVP